VCTDLRKLVSQAHQSLFAYLVYYSEGVILMLVVLPGFGCRKSSHKRLPLFHTIVSRSYTFSGCTALASVDVTTVTSIGGYVIHLLNSIF